MNKQCDCCELEIPKENNCAFLSYSTTDTLTIPLGTSVGTTFRITSLTIDNSCKRFSTVRLKFSSNLVTDASIASINFQIFKQCSKQTAPIAVGSVWSYSRILITSEATSFSFKECDVICDECCVYYVVVTVVTAATAGVISINNANLSALAVFDGCSFEKQPYCGNDECQSDCNSRCFKPCAGAFTKCSSPFNVSVAGGVPAGNTYILASLNINTEKFNHPCIELEFATNTIFSGSLLIAFIQIYKQCDCQVAPIPIGPIWLLDHSLPEIDYYTFSFHIHDCMDCVDGCCNYYALLTVQFAPEGVATLFNNSTLSAIIIDSAC